MDIDQNTRVFCSMKKINYLPKQRSLFSFTIIFIALFISYEIKSQNFLPRQGGNCYTVAIPDYLNRTFQLNDVATLQYMNAAKNAYVVIIDDSKAQLSEVGVTFANAKEFLDFFTKDYLLSVENRVLGDVTLFEIGEYNFAQTVISWTEEEIGFVMLITTLETEGHFYKILCWTTTENKEVLMDDFKKIASSLSE